MTLDESVGSVQEPFCAACCWPRTHGPPLRRPRRWLAHGPDLYIDSATFRETMPCADNSVRLADAFAAVMAATQRPTAAAPDARREVHLG